MEIVSICTMVVAATTKSPRLFCLWALLSLSYELPGATSFAPVSRLLLDQKKCDDQLERFVLPQPAPPDQVERSPLWPIQSDPKRSLAFSACMTMCGAALGPFLDAYHSAFGVLQYDEPIQAILWGSADYPALTTAWWVPELFGLAGFLIGWLYILLDHAFLLNNETPTPGINETTLHPSWPKILVGISFFTLQYWLSGILYSAGVDRTTLLSLLSVLACVGFTVLDRTVSGFLVSAATALGGPLIEAGILTLTVQGQIQGGGYHYTDLGETGFFPLWIVPVYFLGGPANGNLARGFWTALSENTPQTDPEKPCPVCNDTRQVSCPNCEGVGEYKAMGERVVSCTSCRGRGFVMCRSCFERYGEDPWDIDAVREKMSRMPD